MPDTPQPEGLQQPYTSHVITEDHITAWLAEHGLAADDVCTATISVGWSRPARHVCAWLDAEWYKRDGKGHRYPDPDDHEQAAMGRTSVPLHSWPPLTPATPPTT